MSTGKSVLLAIVAIVVGYIVLKMVLGLAIGLVMSLLPILVIGGAIYVAYVAFGKKALGGGRRTLP